MENACMAPVSKRRGGRSAPGRFAKGHRAVAELASEERAQWLPVGGFPRPIVFQVLRDMVRGQKSPTMEMPDDGVQIVALIGARGFILGDARHLDVEGIARVVVRAILERNGEATFAVARLVPLHVFERKLLAA